MALNDPDYHVGCDFKGFVKPEGAATALEVDVNRWTCRTTGNNKDVSGSRMGRRRIPGCPDASGTMDMHYDTANIPSDTATDSYGIRHGKILDVDLAPVGAAAGDTGNFRATIIVDEVTYQGEFDGVQEYNFTWSLAVGSSLKLPGDASGP